MKICRCCGKIREDDIDSDICGTCADNLRQEQATKSKWQLHDVAIEEIKHSGEGVLDMLLLLVMAACLYVGHLTDRLINTFRRS